LFNTTGSNLTINFTDTRYADIITVDTNAIKFNGYRLTDATTEKMTFNITENDTFYNHTSLPYFSASTNTQKTIASGLADVISTNVSIDIYNCDLVSSINYVSSSGLRNRNFNLAYIESNCASNLITLINLPIEKASNNKINIVTSDVERSGICSALPNGLNKISSLISTILIVGITVLLFTILGFLVFKIRDPDYEVPSVDFSNIEVKILISGIGGLIILSVITLFVVQTVCSLG
jgi:hypothetical protein